MPMTPPSKQSEPAKPSRGPTANIEELRYFQQLYQNQYMEVAREISDAISLLQTIETVQHTLENTEEIGDKNAMIPVGPSTYFSGKITDAKTVVMGVGAGYLIEKDINSAKAYMSKMMEKETQHIGRLNKSKKELEGALMEISYKVEELSH